MGVAWHFLYSTFAAELAGGEIFGDTLLLYTGRAVYGACVRWRNEGPQEEPLKNDHVKAPRDQQQKVRACVHACV